MKSSQENEIDREDENESFAHLVYACRTSSINATIKKGWFWFIKAERMSLVRFYRQFKRTEIYLPSSNDHRAGRECSDHHLSFSFFHFSNRTVRTEGFPYFLTFWLFIVVFVCENVAIAILLLHFFLRCSKQRFLRFALRVATVNFTYRQIFLKALKMAEKQTKKNECGLFSSTSKGDSSRQRILCTIF